MDTLGQVRDGLKSLPRRVKQALLILFDVLALLAVLWLSFTVRLGASFSLALPHLALMLLAPALAVPVFIRLGLYRAVIRYLPERALWTIIQAMILATLLWVTALFFAEATRWAVFPRTVPFFYFIFGTVVVAGSRFLAKGLLWLPERGLNGQASQVVIYGAGAAGTQLVQALRDHFQVVAFLDDDPTLWGRDVAGIRVHPPEDLEQLILNRGVDEVILSIPSADATRRSEIVADLNRHPVKIRTLPAISDLVAGKYLISQLREIDIDDLLGRSAVPADPALMQEILAGRVILVSGAGGSIGSELTRLIIRHAPSKLVLLEANEFALYEIERALAKLAIDVPVVPVLGSVTDAALVRRTLEQHPVDVIFHAAAHKHVPLVEANALEGVRNNVIGTRVLVQAAVAAKVPRFVLISTDKAVRPSSVMGATKRWAELIVRHYGKGRGSRYCSVRFGNVLGSNGSVVPLFREQIAAGGPVTLTDNRMTRYFMSIHEAAELIVQAGAMAEGGDIFLLEMGEPVSIRQLAENMVRLAGLSVKSPANPEGDIAIVETGARPGEKYTEELFFDPANALRTSQPKILRSPPAARRTDGLEGALASLEAALAAEDEAELRKVLFGFAESGEIKAPAAGEPAKSAAR